MPHETGQSEEIAQAVDINEAAADESSQLTEDNLAENLTMLPLCDDDMCARGHVHVPSYGEMLATPKPKATELTQQMRSLCSETEGFSGRDLGKLPSQALSMMLHGHQHFLHDVTDAMEKVLKESKIGGNDPSGST